MYRHPFFALFIFFISSFSANAQTDTFYFNADWKHCDKNVASYYRIATFLGNDHYKAEDHYKNDMLQMTGTYKGSNPQTDTEIEDGSFVFYDSFGNIESERQYENDMPVGIHKYYFPETHNLRSAIAYYKDSAYGILFDSLTGKKSGEGPYMGIRQSNNKSSWIQSGYWKFYYTYTNKLEAEMNSNKISCTFNISNNRRNGHAVYYYRDGSISAEGNYKNDIVTGTWRMYAYNSKTILFKDPHPDTRYADSVIAISYYSKDHIAKKVTFVHSIPISEECYTIKGASCNCSLLLTQPAQPAEDIDNYVEHNLRYPKDALKNHIEGRVLAGFTVNADGTITNVKILKSLYKSCDEEAIRLIKTMPKWSPEKYKGVPEKSEHKQFVGFLIK